MLWRFNFKLRQSISSERKVLHLLEYSELMKSFWMLYGHDMAWHGITYNVVICFKFIAQLFIERLRTTVAKTTDRDYRRRRLLRH